MPRNRLGLAVVMFCLASVPADADSLDVLQGKYTFNWHAAPSREKCLKVAGKLLTDFRSNKYRCELTAITNTSTGAPARTCTEVKGGKEYLIFDTLRACEDERQTQASNE